MDVRSRTRREEGEEEVDRTTATATPPQFSYRRPPVARRGDQWWRSWWFVVGVAALVVALGWWLLVLKWEWYCFAWASWADPALHDARACRAVQPPCLERGRLLTAAYGFRSVYEGRLNISRLKEEGLESSPLLMLASSSGEDGSSKSASTRGQMMKVVVKELKDPKSCGDVKAHFREVAIERRLRHPSIVPYVVSCSISPRYTLVSEYMEGGTLSVGITPNMASRTYLSIMLDLAKGLEYLHYGVESGYTLIHDDLNPEQILLNANRTRGYITDFNLASWIRSGERWGVRRYWWPKGGSWKWFAPEKLRQHYYWEAADIWSYGVLFYQTLVRANNQPDEWAATVIRPFYEERILNAAVDGWRPSKPHFRSDRVVLDKAWGLVEECWRYDPYARPNATRLVTSLEDLLRQLPKSR